MRNSRRSSEYTCNPVFIVGMNGSGTSMMLDSLGRHPELYALPDETHMMPYIIGQADRFGDLARDENFLAYWQFAIDQMPVLVKFNGGVKPGIPENWRSYSRDIAGVFDGIFSEFAARSGKRRWCEKTPDHVQHIGLLAQVFPHAKFVHLIRDGREVACSIARRQLRRPELVIYRWKKLVAQGQAEGARLGDRYMELNYESLVEDPELEMSRVCSFLSVDFDEQVLLSRMPESPKKQELAEGELGSIVANPIKWPRFFDSKTVARLEHVGGATLARLGYEVQDSAGDYDPGAFQRRAWRLRDFVRLKVRRIKVGRNENYKTIRGTARSIWFSFKQYRTKRY
jgi:hypothetical protein